jgi:hypothetical protein
MRAELATEYLVSSDNPKKVEKKEGFLFLIRTFPSRS